MRTMMRKGVIYAVFAVALLVMAVLVTGCSESLGSPLYQPGEPSSYPYQPGKGAVKLNFNETTRSIAPGTTINSFTSFDIDFQAKSGGAVTDTSNHGIPLANVKGPYDLAPGTYKVVVIGYIGSGEAAIGEVDNIPINPNVITNVPAITLSAYDIGDGGTGTFSWNIHATVTGLSAATMTITQVGGSPLTPVNLYDDKWEGTQSLSVGYYYVDFVLTANSSTRTFRHILHIYKGQISAFSYTFNNSYFTFTIVNVTDPTYNPPGETELELVYGPSDTALVEKGIVTLSISASGGTPASTTITVDNATDYTTIGWTFSGGAIPAGSISTPDGETLTVNTTIAPFTVQGYYQLTVVGIPASGAPSSTYVYISIVP